MSRTSNKPATPAPLPEILPAVAGRIEAAQDQALSASETDEVFAAGLDIGRLEAMDFVVTVTTSAIVAVYESVKKSKAWKYMRNPKNGHGDHFESLEQFCEVKLGKSYERIRKIAANRNLIGQEAFEQAERIGLRQVDYNAIKALPAPKQEIIREALSENADLDTVTRALRELAAQDQREIEALTRERDDARAEQEAAAQLLADKSEALVKAKAAAHRLASAPPETQIAEELKELSDRAHTALSYLRGDLRLGFQKLFDREQDGSAALGGHRKIMAGYVRELEYELDVLKGEFFLLDLPADPAAPAAAAAN